MEPAIPSATYRLQFNRGFTLSDAVSIVDYLHDLGISHVYASPLLAARPGSLHGYDMIDPTRLNPELGSEADLAALASALHARGMGLIVDVVPNHMCVADAGNAWWMDVLTHGPSSPHARTFDIEWHPAKVELADRVLLPILGDQFGAVLESGQIRAVYDDGAFFADYFGRRLPLAPKSWGAILEPTLETVRRSLGTTDAHVLELESILSALRHLPARTETDPVSVQERQRECQILRRRLAALAGGQSTVWDAIHATLRRLNGTKDDPRSFDGLDAVLRDQAYRLCDWRVACDEINYRRFFDINDLAAIRVEELSVFKAVYARVLEWVRRGWVSGLRIDHIDGLYDPRRHLADLQAACGARGSFYIVVEKILGADENLRLDWPMAGATGYGFLNLVNGVLVDASAAAVFAREYASFTGAPQDVGEIVRTSKKLIMLVSMASEIHMLAWRLDRISEQHRRSRDFTLESLTFALREVIASFPVYRTYMAEGPISDEDRCVVEAAVAEAQRRNPSTSASLFGFIGSVLLAEDPPGLSPQDRAIRRDFARRFQQVTGPVMAKGVEDTAFYRYFPLASLNEVGAEPGRFGVPVARFHEANVERMRLWPHALIATTTHDTKRSEDVRARLNVLSEVPDAWWREVRAWRVRNARHRTQSGIPDANGEYLLYQTLVALWGTGGDLAPRVTRYMVKALREAKIHTSWINPNDAYERAVTDFTEAVLSDDAFLTELSRFVTPLAHAGWLNAIAQTLLKIVSPGVPDFYQGAETWSFTLVDPDNREPVDFARRRELLDAVRDPKDRARLARELVAAPHDGRLKLFVTREALRFRRDHAGLFAGGSCVPLTPGGKRADHVIALARVRDHVAVVAVAGRLFLRLGDQGWGDTTIALPDVAPGRAWRDVFTGRTLHASAGALALGDVLHPLPVALLEQQQ